MDNLYSTGIRPSLDNYIAEKAKERRSYGEYWSASSAGYCYRKIIFDRLQIPETSPLDVRKAKVFEVGHIFHSWVQGLTKEAGLSIAQELELQDENLMIRGHIDDLVLVAQLSDNEMENLRNYPDPKTFLKKAKLILYDYKTQNSKAFTWQKGRPMSHYHKNQLGSYMMMLRNIAREELEKRGVKI